MIGPLALRHGPFMDPVQPSYIMITTQILTIIYIFAVLGNKIWWKLAAALQCVEVTLVSISVLILQVPSPIEMAYILAFTSQAAAIGVIWASSRGIFRNRIQKHTADHLLGLGLVTCLVLAILLPLSLVGHFPRWTTLQWIRATGEKMWGDLRRSGHR